MVENSAWIVHIPLLGSTHFHVDIGKFAKSINCRAPFLHLPTLVPVVGQVVNNESHLWELCNALVCTTEFRLQGLNEEGTSTHYIIYIAFWELVLVAQKLGGRKHMLIQRLNLT